MSRHNTIPPPSRQKSLLFGAVICLGYLVFAEMLARGVFAALAGSPLPFLYGFDRDIKFVPEATLLHPSFFNACEDCGAPAGAPAQVGTHLVYAFGGSTTQGANCSSDASSWPAELGAARRRLEVVNFGLNGTNSDYAVDRLVAALHERVPDLVLWANWHNELDVVYEGPERNREALRARFGPYLAEHETGFALARGQSVLAGVDRTLFEISGLYLLLSKAVDQWAHNTRAERQRGRKLTNRDQAFAIANTLLNLDAARTLANRHGFSLAVVRLPIVWSRLEREYGDEMAIFVREWNRALMNEVQRYAQANGIAVLDLQEVFEDGGDAGLYCDSIHMVRDGHRRLAAALVRLMEAAALLPEEAGS